MSALEMIRRAEASGIRLGVEGADLILDADLEPPVDLVNAISRYKTEIIELIVLPGDSWTAEDWRALFDERADAAVFDRGQTRAEAETRAFDCCIIEWLNRHSETSDPDRCAWCGEPDRDGRAIVPFGTECDGHAWLHPECWNLWNGKRRKKARQALAAMSLCALSHP